MWAAVAAGMSTKSRVSTAQIGPLRRPLSPTMLPVNESNHPPVAAIACAMALVLCAAAPAAQPEAGADPADARASDAHEYEAPVRQMARAALGALPAGARVEVDVGRINPRLKLAPCARITPYLPAGTRLWGRASVGLRCSEGARWNVFVPVTVKVYGPAWTASGPLPAGTVLTAAHLQRGEVDLAAEPSPAVAAEAAALGRTLARAMAAGEALREADLRPRQWFAAGDVVRLHSSGSGFAISGQGQALAAGIDGRLVKVRTESGRIVQGRATGAGQVELLL